MNVIKTELVDPKMGIGHNIGCPKKFNHINDLNFD